jgi:hypothetical protein
MPTSPRSEGTEAAFLILERSGVALSVPEDCVEAGLGQNPAPCDEMRLDRREEIDLHRLELAGIGIA